MEGCSNNGEACPQLLDLIPREREWLVKRADERSSEEKKLELRLGPPGEEWCLGETAKTADNRERDESLLSVGYFSNGNQQNHKFSSPENLQSGSVWFNQQVSQQAKATPFLQFASKTVTPPPPPPQSLPVMAKESSQPCCIKVAVDLQQSAEKKAFSPPAPANTAVPNSSQKRYCSFLPLPLSYSLSPLSRFLSFMTEDIHSHVHLAKCCAVHHHILFCFLFLCLCTPSLCHLHYTIWFFYC